MTYPRLLVLVGVPFLLLVWACAGWLGGEWVALALFLLFLYVAALEWRRVSVAAMAAKVVP